MILQTTHPEFKSSLNITTGATMCFVHLKCSNHGGVVYGENAMIHIGARTRVIFMQNKAVLHGGAMCLINGTINISGNESYERERLTSHATLLTRLTSQ